MSLECFIAIEDSIESFNVSDFKFLSSEGLLNKYRPEAVTFFTEFINWKKENPHATKIEIQKQLGILKEGLQKLPKGTCNLEVCGLVASGKTYRGKIISKILLQLGTEFPVSENDITDEFDTKILNLEEVKETRESRFFKENLRDIGYLTMGLIPGIHAAPFSRGKELKPDIPSLIVRLTEEERMKKFVERNSPRDTGRSPYNGEIESQKVKYNMVDNINSGKLCYLQNGGDINKIKSDLYHFLCTNKENFGIADKSDETIQNAINDVINSSKEKSQEHSEKKVEENKKISNIFQMTDKEVAKDYVDTRERKIRDDNLKSYIKNILINNGLKNAFIDEYINKLYRLSDEKYINWNSQRISDLEKFLNEKQLDQDIIDKIMNEISKCLETKKIDEKSRESYVNAKTNQILISILKRDTEAVQELKELANNQLFSVLDETQHKKEKLLLSILKEILPFENATPNAT